MRTLVAVSAEILIVEDEAVIRSGLCDLLALQGYVPVAVGNGEQGLAQARAKEHALVILDVMLPEMSGLDVCRLLRAERPTQAILLLTARGSESDVLDGFRSGADDYVTKPFSVAELLARVAALLRRSAATTADPVATFVFGAWAVDPHQRTACSAESSVVLSSREVALLALLARERGRIVGRRQLLAEVWGMQHVEAIETRTVDMHVAKLRKKLAAGGVDPIATVRGEGYRYGG